MKHLFTLFLALIATTAMWAEKVIKYTATEKLPETTDTYESGLHMNAFNTAIVSHSFSSGQGTITFADEVTRIGSWAFYGCISLTSITIPNSVTEIIGYAFEECTELVNVTFGKSLRSIGMYAFRGDIRIAKMVCTASRTPDVSEDAFSSISSYAYLYVPRDYVHTYRVDPNWGRFDIKGF